jgi:tRNA(His) 5'-end guanylyltransferase
MSDNIPLGDRMKRYEHATRQFLPRRTYVLMRLDGRAFHSYLYGAERPFDRDFMGDMNLTALRLLEEIQGARFAYVQSDEISILITDFEETQTEPWFGGNMSKLLSVSAGLASAYFALLRREWPGLPHFDSRVWVMSDPVEVANYFVWRQRDAVRNSIQMVGQTYFSPRQLQRKSLGQIQEMLSEVYKINWNDFPPECKRGRLIFRNDWTTQTVAAPLFKAEAGTELAELIPQLPSLRKGKAL